MWYSGAIQMEYCDTKSRDDDTTNRLEYGIGVTADGTKVTVWATRKISPTLIPPR